MMQMLILLLCVCLPILATLGNPFPHCGVKCFPGHNRVLGVWVKQVLQGSQPVLFWTLACHSLQEIQDCGG